jgi:peptidoglycan-associated lipoprotein
MRHILAVHAALLVLLLSGCAKQPATTQASAPSPTGTAGGISAPPGRAQSTPTGAGTTGRAVAGRPDGASARPAPRDFSETSALKDIHFDFDKYDLRPSDTKTLETNAGWLKANASQLLLIEGHADERGTDAYNLALGERRAQAAMNYLIAQGIRASRIAIVSYGEERPVCRDHNEACWARNRRDHFLTKAE